MDSSAYFFCNIHDYDELIYKTRNAEKNNYKRQKYKIIDTIILDDENFKKFKKKFLQYITAKLRFSEECEYLCLAVINEHSDAIILVCSFQYSYPKFVAVVRRTKYGKKIY